MRMLPLFSFVPSSLALTFVVTSLSCGAMDKVREYSAQGKAMVEGQDFGGRSQGEGESAAPESGQSGADKDSGEVKSCPKALVEPAKDGFGLEDVRTTYEGSIKAVINTKCAWCHSPQASRPKRPYLTTYDEVKREALAVLDSMTGQGEERMPPRFARPQLTSTDARLFTAWRDGGYKKGTPPPPPGPADSVFYLNDIKLLMTNNCTGCHGAGGTSPNLTTYASVKASATASLVAIQSGRMPPAGPLAVEQVKAFKNWVDAKTPYSKDDAAGAGVTAGDMSVPATGTPDGNGPGATDKPSECVP